MGMNFSPMYQPVSTKTIKADGDLNVNPYDLLATDVKCDTVEASEFVGGVGNFSSMVMPTLSYNGFYTLSIKQPGNVNGNFNPISRTIFSSPFALSGVVSVKSSRSDSRMGIISADGYSEITLTTTQTEYNITNAYVIFVFSAIVHQTSDITTTFTIGIPAYT